MKYICLCPRCECILGIWRIVPVIINFWTRCVELFVSIQGRWSLGKGSWYSLNRMLGGHQSWCEHPIWGREKSLAHAWQRTTNRQSFLPCILTTLLCLLCQSAVQKGTALIVSTSVCPANLSQTALQIIVLYTCVCQCETERDGLYRATACSYTCLHMRFPAESSSGLC